MPESASTLTLKTPRSFDLPQAVCSYGYFLLAPNLWNPARQCLHRTLRGDDGRVVRVTLAQPRRRRDLIKLTADRRLSPAERTLFRRQVARMLRLDEDLRPWFAMDPAARRRRYGRLFRSPTLFEDMVKTITGCNVTWRNTMAMNRLLCLWAVPPEHEGGFPLPTELATLDPDDLKQRCKVGYRADRIVRLARDLTTGALDPATLEDPAVDTDTLHTRLLAIHGIGPYAAANLLQLLGRYDKLAIDTETYRHFCLTYGVKRPKNPLKLHRRIQRHYDRFAPYQFLAYWFELWRGYERRFGPAITWDPIEHGPNFTAAYLNREA